MAAEKIHQGSFAPAGPSSTSVFPPSYEESEKKSKLQLLEEQPLSAAGFFPPPTAPPSDPAPTPTAPYTEAPIGITPPATGSPPNQTSLSYPDTTESSSTKTSVPYLHTTEPPPPYQTSVPYPQTTGPTANLTSAPYPQPPQTYVGPPHSYGYGYNPTSGTLYSHNNQQLQYSVASNIAADVRRGRRIVYTGMGIVFCLFIIMVIVTLILTLS